MELFLDCEFNGDNGFLISMGFVSLDGTQEFYEVVEHGPTNEWVTENVIPILNKPAISKETFKEKLTAFLLQFPSIQIIVDHGSDAWYFADYLKGIEGKRAIEIPVDIRIDSTLTAKHSTLLHNALEDAKALRLDYIKQQGYL